MVNEFRAPSTVNYGTLLGEIGLHYRIVKVLSRPYESLGRSMDPIITVGNLLDRCTCELQDVPDLGPSGISFIENTLRPYGFSLRPCHWVSSAAAYAAAKVNGLNPCGYMAKRRVP